MSRISGAGISKQSLPSLIGSFLKLVLVAASLLNAGCANLQSDLHTGEDRDIENASSVSRDKSLLLDSETTEEEALDEAGPSKGALIAAGDEAWKSGDTEKALFEYLRALKLDDTDKSIYFKIGYVHEYGGKYKLAELAYKQASQIDPSYVPALERTGSMELKQRKNIQAKQSFKRAIELDQQRLNADVSQKTREPGTQSNDAQVENSFPGYKYDRQSPFDAYVGLGIIEDLEGKHQKAIEVYDVARRIAPESAYVYNNMGYSCYLSNDLEMAELLFKKAVTRDPNYKVAWRNLALLYVRSEQYDKAIDILRNKVQNEASAYNTVGYLCMLDRKYRKAELFLKKAIDLSPVYFEAANDNLKINRELAAKQNPIDISRY